jgi:Na+(H+)/acetate symporter ActP
MMTGIIFIIGVLVLGFLFLVHNAMTKPIYNKMHNMWQDDPEGRKVANITLLVMLFVAFYLGTLF